MPYGRDNASAIALNRVPREAFKHMRGDLTLFERQDGVEAMWDVVDPLVERWEAVPPRDFPNYRAGTWGPAAAEELLARTGRRWLTV